LQVENGRRDVNFGFADHDHPSAATAPWDQADECFALRLFASFFLARLLALTLSHLVLPLFA